jgi:hypothetical protein
VTWIGRDVGLWKIVTYPDNSTRKNPVFRVRVVSHRHEHEHEHENTKISCLWTRTRTRKHENFVSRHEKKHEKHENFVFKKLKKLV